MKRVWLAMAMLLLLTAAVSCQYLKRETRFVIALHQVVENTLGVPSTLLIRVQTMDGSDSRIVKNFPLINSRHIVKIECVPGPNKYKMGLKLYFDRFAPGIWAEVGGTPGFGDAAVIVDGFLCGFMELPKLLDDSLVLEVPAIFTPAEAKLIADNAERNYDVINDR